MSRGRGGRDAAAAEGLALLDKPPGISSFQVLGAVKRALGTSRVGHTGTLDRFARGLIVALTGRLTRLAPLLAGQDKSYTARVRFGEETSTLDPEGEVIATGPVPSRAALDGAIPGLVGEIEQVPPVYSAVHHEGERAYRLARRGERPELRPRKVRIRSLDLLAYEPPFADLLVRCGAGTYVRSLARDLAVACGSRATVVDLVRTEVGPFRLAEAVEPATFVAADLLSPSCFLPRLGALVLLHLDDAGAARVSVGVLPRGADLLAWPMEATYCALFDGRGGLLAVLERADDGSPSALAVFPLDRPRRPAVD